MKETGSLSAALDEMGYTSTADKQIWFILLSSETLHLLVNSPLRSDDQRASMSENQ